MSEVQPAHATTMTPALTLTFAVATGAIVASLYYSQPLLAQLASALGVREGAAALLVTVTQLGYAAGLALLVPLGDTLDRRRLIFTLLGLAAGGLLLAGLAPGFGVFALASVLIGLTSVAAQVLVPFAATLASDVRRGQVVGTVMSGLLLGILLARTFAGAVAGAFGWRAVYFAAAGMVLGITLLLARVLPHQPPAQTLRYPALLRSVLDLARREPELRRRSLYGALGFAAFSVFWTSLAFLLVRPPYRYSEAQIGLFGLAGAAGALAASFAGRWADAGHSRATTGAFAVLILGSFGLIGLGAHSLAALLAGVLLLDLGVQGLHITNQSEVYRLQPAARSRITTVYLTSYFLGGAAGSALTSLAYAARGWAGVSWLGALLGAGIVAAWVFSLRRTA